MAELTVQEFLLKAGFESELSGSAHRYHVCPKCGPGRSGKFWARDDFGSCNACGFGGDLFVIAGAVLDLDPRTNFPKLLKACAALAGVTDDYDPVEARTRLDARRSIREEKECAAKLVRERAERGASSVWDGLARQSEPGQAYLATRGIVRLPVTQECRFGTSSVCLPLWRGGEVVSVVGRRFDGGSPKVRGLAGCGTLGTFGRPVRSRMHTGPVVVVEGFMDYLSARALSPSRLVLGAHGALRLEYLAQIAAEIIDGTALGLVLVPHQDCAGLDAVKRAAAAAIRAGVNPSAIAIFEVQAGCNDLNDHLLSGRERAL